MRITDINCMIGHWSTRRRKFKTSDELLAVLDKYRISDCVAYHSTAVWSPNRGNSVMKELAEKSSGRIKACYILEPNLGSSVMPEADQLICKLRREKPSAVRLDPVSKRFRVDDFYCGELLEVLNELEMPVLFDADQTPGFDYLPTLAKTYPKIKFVILRRGFNESRYIVPIIRKLNNVYFDTSIMIDTGIIEEIVNKYGSEKLLFGSGLPFFVPAGAISMILYSRIKDNDKENILYKNWLSIEGVK
jgi:predicted TIM-barrel fold metal-dependent hydrolase